MKLYRVHYDTEGGHSAGFSWHASRKEAEAFARRAQKDNRAEYESTGRTDIQDMIIQVRVQPTKNGILALVQNYASHPDNG